jgi:Ca2+-binding RTX toxin-like protein
LAANCLNGVSDTQCAAGAATDVCVVAGGGGQYQCDMDNVTTSTTAPTWYAVVNGLNMEVFGTAHNGSGFCCTVPYNDTLQSIVLRGSDSQADTIELNYTVLSTTYKMSDWNTTYDVAATVYGDEDPSAGGGSHADILEGSPDASGTYHEFLYGYDGNDTIVCLAGDDYASGGDGNDVIDGGPGDDVIDGNADNDTINGDQDQDEIDAGSGDDQVCAGTGDDVVDGGAHVTFDEMWMGSASAAGGATEQVYCDAVKARPN